MLPDDLVAKHFRLIPQQISALKRLGIRTIRDILYHFPSRYEPAGAEGSAGNLIPGTKVTLIGTLRGLKAKKLWKSRRPATEGWFEDSSGRVKVIWFNQPYIKSYVHEGVVVKITGSVGGKPERPYISNPEIEQGTFDEASSGLFASPSTSPLDAPPSTLFPVYPESQGITSRWFFHALQKIFATQLHTQLDDPIPKDIRKRFNLPDLASALVWVHVPEKISHTEAARKRFAFEEIFVLQTSRALDRARNDVEPAFLISSPEERAEKFLSALTLAPTNAQKRAIEEIVTDLSKKNPMARLLEGDVGSGKTLVAAATSYAVVTSRPPNRMSGTLQVAYMAPTEILAQQHFESFVRYFSSRGGSASGGKHAPLNINIALITGSGCKKYPSKVSRDTATDISRSQLLKWVANGEIAMVVGTHALIQKKVKFQHLAYAIVDEQHRFGTRQRHALAHKSASARDGRDGGHAAPHFLSMTATPIPRTLALTLYGDLDISVLDELPPGRAKVTTEVVTSKTSGRAYAKMREELMQGRQVFVICPRIDEPDPKKMNALQAKSAKAEAVRLQKEVFPEFTVGLLHGGMRPAAKEETMKEFVENKIQILVATSVVEVGVNVPNATVILIEGAERFGLAQLHQLRGRVMRSSHPPYCFLASESKSEPSVKRLKTMANSDDGFALAEADLETRGAGDLFGRRQWGVSDIGMEALRNPRLIQAAREEAFALVSRDPALFTVPSLRERVAAISQELHSE